MSARTLTMTEPLYEYLLSSTGLCRTSSSGCAPKPWSFPCGNADLRGAGPFYGASRPVDGRAPGAGDRVFTGYSALTVALACRTTAA